MPGDLILHGDNLALMADFADGAFRMVYADPPFNTGRSQTRTTVRVTPDAAGDRTGFGGRRYRTELLERSSYRDSFDDYLGFLEPRLREIHRLLDAEGTLYLHLDQREAHYVKLLLDEIFGRECFLNELVWAYDYGAKPKRRWPAKHDTILVYVRDPGAVSLRLGGGRARAVHGAGARHGREGRPRQAPDRRLVAHDRLADRPREDRLPDPEAGRHRAADAPGVDSRRATGCSIRSPGPGRWGRRLRSSAGATS